ncbi:MAG TPA: hypothetical protein VEA99_20390 [Gemmatimonadaceae bacterium]|nr:hypothetical protein [Gemmatimonadaceae bacterium]
MTRLSHPLARLVTLLSLGALAVLASPLDAQRAHPVLSLRTGDTVRVWTSTPVEQVGVLTAAPADSLSLRRFDGRAVAVPVAALSHVDVQRGRKRSPLVIVAGILGGAAVGVVAGGFAGAGLECLGGCSGDLGGLAGMVIGGLGGGVVGAITGGVLGSRYRVRQWQRVFP